MGEFELGAVIGIIVGIGVGIPLGWFIAQSATGGFSNWKTVENLEAWELWEDEHGRAHAEVRRKVKRVE